MESYFMGVWLLLLLANNLLISSSAYGQEGGGGGGGVSLRLYSEQATIQITEF